MPFLNSADYTNILLLIVVGLLSFALAYASMIRSNGAKDRLTFVLAAYGVISFALGNIGFLYMLIF